MAHRKHAEKQSRTQSRTRSQDAYPRPTEVHEDSRTQRVRERGQAEAKALAAELKDGMDEMLDEIDSVLETNAQDFVEGYRQVGGQ